MSILIRGMEMPTDGEAVVLVISNENGKTLAEVDEYCGAVYEAVPVPPHGRLIDADAMEKEVCGGCKHGRHKYENCIDCALANAPIIIPADIPVMYYPQVTGITPTLITEDKDGAE